MTTQTLFRPRSRMAEPEVTAPADAGQAGAPARPAGRPATLLALRLFAAAALLLTAYLHFVLALEAGLGGALFTLPQLFVAQAAAAAIAAGLLMVGDHGVWWLPALAVAVGSAVPLLASVYFPLPAIGPMPPINEPIWYTEKILSLGAAMTVPMVWAIRRIAPPQS